MNRRSLLLAAAAAPFAPLPPVGPAAAAGIPANFVREMQEYIAEADRVLVTEYGQEVWFINASIAGVGRSDP